MAFSSDLVIIDSSETATSVARFIHMLLNEFSYDNLSALQSSARESLFIFGSCRFSFSFCFVILLLLINAETWATLKALNAQENVSDKGN